MKMNMKLVTFGYCAFNIWCIYYVDYICSSALNFNKTRAFSTDHGNSNNLDPNFVTGFADASPKALVVFGTNLTSTVGVKFSRKQLATVILVPYTRDIIVGLLLSDG